MVRSSILALLVFLQSAVLLLAGLATLWWSQDLMRWLIWMVGEERTLGAGNVVPLEGGGRLLTNPTGMIRWMLPFWALGLVQILSSATLVWLWARRPNLAYSAHRAEVL